MTTERTALKPPAQKATLQEVYDWLRGLSDSEFAAAASGKYCEDVLSLIVGSIGRSLTPQAPADVVERVAEAIKEPGRYLDFTGDHEDWKARAAIAAIPPSGRVEELEDALETARQRAMVLFQAYALGVSMQHGRGEEQFIHDVKTFGDRYMAGISGAPCTGELKFVPRLNFELPTDIHIFGYTADASDKRRAERLRGEVMNFETPLIERGITKANCLALLEGAGIELPRTYAMGFPNANCLKSGCVKATSASYWALHRKCFPEGFAKTAALARELGVRLARIGEERVFIDDIPLDHPTTDPIAPTCDLLCNINAKDLAA